MMNRYFKWGGGSILALILAFFGYKAFAVDSNLSWTLPTTFTDGTPIPAGDLTSVQIYRKVGTGAYSLYKTIPIGTTYADTNLASGTYCYEAAVVRSNGIASALTNEVCKTVDTRVPNTFTLTVN